MNPNIQLTPKEKDVLDILFTGKRDKEIADILSVSTHTIKFHCMNLQKKFGASNRTEVIYKALLLGILKVPVQMQIPFQN